MCTGECDSYCLIIGTRSVSVSNICRLSTAEDSETALEADIARLSTMQEQREASSRSGERGGQVANGTSVEVITLQCVVEAQDRDLATLKERIAALQVCF